LRPHGAAAAGAGAHDFGVLATVRPLRTRAGRDAAVGAARRAPSQLQAELNSGAWNRRRDAGSACSCDIAPVVHSLAGRRLSPVTSERRPWPAQRGEGRLHGEHRHAHPHPAAARGGVERSRHWTAPDTDVKGWLRRGRWVATAYLANSYGIVARIAELLGEHTDAVRYRRERERVIRAYRNVFTDGQGTLHTEFQTGYVLPLAFGMTEGAETERMVDNLVRLIDDAGGHLQTGFTGTPFILFALSDSGRLDEAYRLLLQTGCPSWLY